MHECNMHWQMDGFSHWVAKIGEPFGLWFHFEFLGDHHRWMSTHKVKNLCMYMTALFNKEIGFYTTMNLTGLSAPGSIFEKFLGNRCQVVWKSYSWSIIMGGYLHSYTEFRTLRVRTYQRRDGLSHYQNLTSLSAFGSILKIFWEPALVSVKVILLVWHDKTLHTMVTRVSTKR